MELIASVSYGKKMVLRDINFCFCGARKFFLFVICIPKCFFWLFIWRTGERLEMISVYCRRGLFNNLPTIQPAIKVLLRMSALIVHLSSPYFSQPVSTDYVTIYHSIHSVLWTHVVASTSIMFLFHRLNKCLTAGKTQFIHKNEMKK